MSEIIFSDATRLAELIRTKQVSPVEVVQAHLDRIDALDPQINAIVTLADGAIEAAKAAEAAVLAGEDLAPLHGCSLHGEGLHRHRGGPDTARFADLQGSRARLGRDQRGAHEEGGWYPAREDEPS